MLLGGGGSTTLRVHLNMFWHKKEVPQGPKIFKQAFLTNVLKEIWQSKSNFCHAARYCPSQCNRHHRQTQRACPDEAKRALGLFSARPYLYNLLGVGQFPFNTCIAHHEPASAKVFITILIKFIVYCNHARCSWCWRTQISSSACLTNKLSLDSSFLAAAMPNVTSCMAAIDCDLTKAVSFL